MSSPVPLLHSGSGTSVTVTSVSTDESISKSLVLARPSSGDAEGSVLFGGVVPGRMRADELAFEEDLDRVSKKPDLDVFAPIGVTHPIARAGRS